MKFVLKSTSASGRLGVISNISRLNGFEMETPHALLYTNGGTVPHLTHEVLEMVSKEKLALSIPVQNVYHVQEPMKVYKQTIADYIGMKEYLTYCSCVNPMERTSNNTFINGNMRIMTRNGNKIFSAESYMQFMEHLQPDMFMLLADGATNSKSSKRRIKNSFDNSVNLFEKCLDMYKKSDILKNSKVLGAVEGGFNLSFREESSKIIGESSLFGVVIDGLHDCSDTVMHIETNEIKPVVEASLKHIANDKLRVIHGCWNPSAVLDLIELGIDLFDSSYPTFITEQSGALTFPNTDSILVKYSCNGVHNEQSVNENQNDQSSNSEKEEPLTKKMKLSNASKYYMSMSDPCHTTDFTPISKNCTCLACKKHTRAYIHHLVNVNEMLGPVLLMIHNLHHYLLFLSTIRKQLQMGKFKEFKRSFQKWLDENDGVSSPT